MNYQTELVNCMAEIDFDIIWQQPNTEGGDKAVSVTWAQFAIKVGDEIVSEYHDWRAQTNDDRIFLPLYPLAEWIAVNWWHLLYEPFAPEQQLHDREGYFYRHNLRYARSGFSLPDLTIQPQGSTSLLSWKAVSLKNHKCRFLNTGNAFMDSVHLEQKLSEFIEAVIQRLDKYEVTNTLLQNEWKTIENTDEDERQFCIAAAETGLDPYNYTNEEGDLIIKANDTLPASILRDFYSATSPLKMNRDINAAARAIDLVKNSNSDFGFLRTLRGKLSHNYTRLSPWTEGYEAARSIRKYLNLNGSVIKGLNDLSEVLKVEINNFSKQLDTDISPSIRVIGGANDNGSPVFVLSPKLSNSEPSKKFNLARGLYEYFYGEDFSIVSDVYLESQKRNRAFAAEFLLPSELLRNRIKTEYVSDDQIDDLAEEFNISSKVVEHQIQNHDIALTESRI